ncbi:MAG: glycosyltransferase family 4 protein [Armatimonadetes bacterium]|nr:glycosyltransferase family 4 protein [Armatimonadota bacterium]
MIEVAGGRAPAVSRLPRLACLGKITVPQPFGNEQLLSALYSRVAEHCERLDVVALAADSPAGHEEIDGKIHIHAGPSARGLRSHFEYLRYSLERVRYLERTVQPDLWWVSDPLDSALVGWYARRVSGAPVVVQIQGDMFRMTPLRFNWIKRRIITLLTLWSVAWADRVRVISHDMMRQLRDWGVPPEKLSYVTTRADFALFDPARHQAAGRALREQWGWQESRIALYAGAVQPTKGTDLLVDAFIAVAADLPDLRLVLLGDGPDLPALRARLADAELTDRVLCPGWQPYNSLPAWYAAADFNVVPSRDEGLGRGGIQAAAMERPSLMTRVGGNPEVLRDGVTGWLVEPTVASLAAGLRQAAGCDRLVDMGRAARRFAKARYDFEPVVRTMIDEMLYRVVRERPRSR